MLCLTMRNANEHHRASLDGQPRAIVLGLDLPPLVPRQERLQGPAIPLA